MQVLKRLYKSLQLKVLCSVIFMFSISVTTYAVSSSYSKDKLNLSITNVGMREAIAKIEHKTRLCFFHKNDDLNIHEEITLLTKEGTIEDVLDQLFDQTNIKYTISNDDNIITTKIPPVKTQEEYIIKGKVINSNTGQGIPFCNITTEDNIYSGTSTNEEGAFTLTVNRIPVKLVFTHLNYEQKTVEINQENISSSLALKLQPYLNALEEVVVTAKADKNDKYAVTLAENAFKKIQDDRRYIYGKALYRQKSKNADRFVELAEIIFDVRYSAKGIDNWEILEGRYAINEDNSLNNKNYTILSRLLKVIQPDTDDIIFPLHPELERYYRVKTVSIKKTNKEDIAIISFTPLEGYSEPIFEGEVYINTKTFDVLKISGAIARDDLKFTKLGAKYSSWKDYSFSYQINYKKDTVADVVLLDHIKVNQAFDYYKNDTLQFKTVTVSNMSFFEHYTPTNKKRLGAQFRGNQSDWENLNEIGYNPEFWKDNAIVQRTPLEEEVIASFEKDKAFGSIFINSQEQIALMQNQVSNDPLIKLLSQQTNIYKENNPVEKVYLHTDKDMFSSGDDIWYSAYTILGPYHQYSFASKVLHVDLINSNNEIIKSQTHQLISGRAEGNMELPKNLSSGNYYLRSYTNWMRNNDDAFFFSKRIKLVNEKEDTETANISSADIDLQFFPEGGYAVNNTPGIMAFKAIGKDGLGKKIEGRVIDSKNNQVAFLKTLDRGAGFFMFTPKVGEQYTAILKNGLEYNLPEAIDVGYVITANNTSKRSINVKVKASKNLKRNKFYVVGHIRNVKYFHGKFEFGTEPFVEFEIPKTKLPSGVMTLTILDENKKAWSERAVFVDNQEELVINTEVDHTDFEKRDKISVGIKVTDTHGNPISTSLSVSVTDSDQVEKNFEKGNILTHLLLQSDIKGHIENPMSFFKNDDKKTRSKLDLVMLTHGWRRFKWPKIWNPATDHKHKYDFSEGLRISGVAKDLQGRLLRNKTLNVLAKSKSNLSVYPVNTSPTGEFLVDNFNLVGPTSLVFNVSLSKGKKSAIDSKVTLNKEVDNPPVANYQFDKTYQTNSSINEDKYLKYVSWQRLNDSLSGKTIKLDEVVVKGKKEEPIKENKTPSVFGVTPDATVYADQYVFQGFVSDLLTRVSGIRVLGTGRDALVSIRGSGGPLWVIDGLILPVNNDVEELSGQGQPDGAQVSILSSAGRPGPIPPQVADLNVSDIDRIELLKGASASIYGNRGANGVIVVYTKRGQAYGGIKSSQYEIMGHSPVKEFYVPKYDAIEEKANSSDYRATLYWNPRVQTDKNGKATISFFNSDVAKRLHIDIQGLSEYGVPGAYLKLVGDNQTTNYNQ